MVGPAICGEFDPVFVIQIVDRGILPELLKRRSMSHSNRQSPLLSVSASDTSFSSQSQPKLDLIDHKSIIDKVNYRGSELWIQCTADPQVYVEELLS